MLVLLELASETATKDALIPTLVAEPVAAVLGAYSAKKIAFMWELVYVCAPQHYGAVSCLTVGRPMFGWTFPAFGFMERVKPPTSTYETWKANRVERNVKIVARTRSSGDIELDTRAFQRTIDEVTAGVLIGPFFDLERVEFKEPCIAPRCGSWERHGGTEEPDVRNIDDLLCGEQNSTAGSTHSHRPTDVDGLVGQCRSVAQAFPKSRLRGWSSDFSKAYQQVPGEPPQLQDIVLAQYDPINLCVVFLVAFSSVFGSKTAPVKFARFPALFCELVARLFRLPATHCVDDMIFVETESAESSGKQCWDLLMRLAGWHMESPRLLSSPSLASR